MAPAAVAGGSFGVEAVRSLASVADVNRLLHEASARERAIDSELEQLLFKRSELEQQLLQLHVSTEEVRRGAAWRVGGGWVGAGGALLPPLYCSQQHSLDSQPCASPPIFTLPYTLPYRCCK
jgi:hypothetical protein